MTELTLTASRTIAAPADRIYRAWLDPAKMALFMAPGPTMTVPFVQNDPRVGGRFALTMAQDGKEIPHAGTYLVLEPFSRLVFTWESPFSVPDSTVTVTLSPASGGTRVDLTQVKFASPESRDGHLQGWTGILNKLDMVA